MSRLAFALVLSLLAPALTAGEGAGGVSEGGVAPPVPRVEAFTPAEPVRGLRQVTARFSQPMVPLGTPRREAPFGVECPVQGKGRWLDGRTWAFDFEAPLPGGLECRFTLLEGLAALDGTPVGGERSFLAGTGGPSVAAALPTEGSERVDERQVFVLRPDGAVRAESVASHSHCEVEGLGEQIPVRLITGAEREEILGQRRALGYPFLGLLAQDGDLEPLLEARTRGEREEALVLLQCQRPLPPGQVVRLVWGAGIVSSTGVATLAPQVLQYRTRRAFLASLSCERVNAQADCLPMRPMRLEFSAPVAREQAAAVELLEAGGTARAGRLEPEGGDWVEVIHFDGPFAAESRLEVRMPPGLTDDSGRPLENAARFPLQVEVDEWPPLAVFPSAFGILERLAEPVLPVTVRNLEPAPQGQAPAEPVGGRYKRMGQDDAEILRWLKRVEVARWPAFGPDPEAPEDSGRRVNLTGAVSVFAESEATERFTLPAPQADKALEVVGIPLPEAGFYVLELASPRLGAALLGREQTMYVQTAALVTDLAVHFKRGAENSLVWVTSLSAGEPVAGATVQVSDCEGARLWTGQTDAEGLARIPGSALPALQSTPWCEAIGNALFVSARTETDLGFAMSSWDRGIGPWEFNLPTASWDGPQVAHTVFDRTLVRAGETVHMKHFLRSRTGQGLELPPAGALPDTLVITHAPTGQSFEQALEFDQGTAVGQWEVPREARLGLYLVGFRGKDLWLSAGQFQVAEFRVPTMRASVQSAAADLVGATETAFDVQLAYLDGGAAAGAPVALRTQLEPRAVSFPAHPDFLFGGQDVSAGVEPGGDGLERYYAPSGAPEGAARATAQVVPFTLDEGGAGRVPVGGLAADQPRSLLAELEYRDANGETLTVAARTRLWPSAVVLGFGTGNWLAARDRLAFEVLAVDIAGVPLAGREVVVDLFERRTYSYRKRLIGGFYAYEHHTETTAVGEACRGLTDARGRLACTVSPPASGRLVARARASDEQGRVAVASYETWVPGAGDWWFDVQDSDRMDVLAERGRYEPGETARLQVRMPFRQARALVTVEREGVLDAFIATLSGSEPVVELPVQAHYGPNVFVSVLALRGRVQEPAPTAMVDLARPAFRLGYARLEVGWKPYALTVEVTTPGEEFRPRDRVEVRVSVRRADGGPLPEGAEFALAAVDEGLLELAPNESWSLLERMLAPRGLAVHTATAQLQVVGKRHYGRKAVPQGGGGGRQSARELFDTLVAWQPRVAVDAAGEAVVPIALNDSLTAFRIVAVASAGSDLYGTGSTTIRSTQPLSLLSGLPPVVRAGDRYGATFTLRNASGSALPLQVAPHVLALRPDAPPAPLALAPRELTLEPGRASELRWELEVPAGAVALRWEVAAAATVVDQPGAAPAADRLVLDQQVLPAVPVRTLQASLVQVEGPLSLPVERPPGALEGAGGLEVALRPSLAQGLAGVSRHMAEYPYTCLEQRLSAAVALGEEERWQGLMRELPAYADADGLLRFFPGEGPGSEVLTAYVLAVAHQAGRELPAPVRARAIEALAAFVQGTLVRPSPAAAPDLPLRKLAALEALARYGAAQAAWLDSLTVEPNLWPTSALVDWLGVLARLEEIPERQARRREALEILRGRYYATGSTLVPTGQGGESPPWLLGSPDQTAVRVLLAVIDEPGWREDLPKLARGALGMQSGGHWDTTLANAWGRLAFEALGKRLELAAVSGATTVELAGERLRQDWSVSPEGSVQVLPWPAAPASLALAHEGGGGPWALVSARAAVPLTGPVESGFNVRRRIEPVVRAREGLWTRGDVLRVVVEFESAADMAWVVVEDPVPAGATLLGRGLQRDSVLLEAGAQGPAPTYEERGLSAFRAYYQYLPAGRWSVQYTLRLNSAGRFQLPPTRVEAMYAPEAYAEAPNAPLEVEAPP